MSDTNIILPSKPRVVSEKEYVGVYEIDGLYPGYGHTLGNSLRRIILSSLSGATVTLVKIEGVSHEFTTLEGVKEDVITLLLNIKKLRFRMHTDEPQKIHLSTKKVGPVTARDIKLPSQVELFNPDVIIGHVTDKTITLDIEMTVEQGLGYVPKELLHKNKVEIGTIALDATFTPVRRVNYEVENMRVGDRTDFNRLKIFIETDGVVMPRQALERSIEIMINQLKAIIGFQENSLVNLVPEIHGNVSNIVSGESSGDTLKIKIEDLELSARTQNALVKAGIKTVGGLVRKRESDLLKFEGFGEKALNELKQVLSNYKLSIKEE